MSSTFLNIIHKWFKIRRVSMCRSSKTSENQTILQWLIPPLSSSSARKASSLFAKSDHFLWGSFAGFENETKNRRISVLRLRQPTSAEMPKNGCVGGAEIASTDVKIRTNRVVKNVASSFWDLHFKKAYGQRPNAYYPKNVLVSLKYLFVY